MGKAIALHMAGLVSIPSTPYGAKKQKNKENLYDYDSAVWGIIFWMSFCVLICRMGVLIIIYKQRCSCKISSQITHPRPLTLSLAHLGGYDVFPVVNCFN